ncbi:Isochorismatase-like protein [Boeremia exigua]|uniref:Isochorismatase-like protein n=1 Tax=Boeremia exigua TaxID=749465 RepID=UPI001E8D3E0B|nr:Isochorismatase-like protein [Boeremia exigua]KAH6615378.1 Isochorismatase-like protein [Boeremia exigua]
MTTPIPSLPSGFVSGKTAVVLVDVYNEFLHPEGKINSFVSESMTASNTIQHLRDVVNVARKFRIPIYYALHQNWRPGNYEGWKHMNATTTGLGESRALEEGSWGAEIFPGLEPDVLGNNDVIVSKHWNSSGFANTDLDYQLHQREVTHLIMAGMIANTCLESTARYARELGYHVTLLTDATAGFSTAHKDAATNLIWPIIADQVKTVHEWTKIVEEGSCEPK